MKKIFLLVAFAGMVGASAVSAGNLRQDDKNKTEHHDCSKHAKGECKKDGKDATKHCENNSNGKKACCKKGATPAK
jgi:hypothetical protein